MRLLGAPLKVANAGLDLFARELRAQGVSVRSVDWRPPAPAAEDALRKLALHSERIDRANDLAVARLQEAHPVLAGVGVASDLIEAMEPHTFLHAGPPIDWESMSGPLRGAVIGAALLEGVAASPEEASGRARAGEFRFLPCHERGAVGPMAGVISSSMPLWIVYNVAAGNRAYCSFNEGLGVVLRYGAYGDEVIARLRWMGEELARVLGAALARLDEPLDLRATIAQALQMGDEVHNRSRAATSLLLRALMPSLLALEEPSSAVMRCVKFISSNDHFFLNLAMPAAKATADAAAGIDASSIVVAMARNGTEFGVRLAGTGERWFVGAAGSVDGLFLPDYDKDDANPDIGDSTITETVGLGGFAMAAAPAIVRFVGGTSTDALAATTRMYEIAWAESDHYQIPALSFRGSPLGIDCRAVAHTGVLPVINTGIAHKEAGVGQVGAGLAVPPMEAFVGAVEGLADTL